MHVKSRTCFTTFRAQSLPCSRQPSAIEALVDSLLDKLWLIECTLCVYVCVHACVRACVWMKVADFRVAAGSI